MIELRNAKETDAANCLKLLAELQVATGSQHSEPSLALESLIDLSRGQIVMAEEDGEILGMATVSYNIALRYGGEYCQLEELIVTPAARGKKLGGLLMDQVLANATGARLCGNGSLSRG